VKVRPDRLVAATALGLVLALYGQTGQAQQGDPPRSEAQAVVVPVPEAAKHEDGTSELSASATATIPADQPGSSAPAPRESGSGRSDTAISSEVVSPPQKEPVKDITGAPTEAKVATAPATEPESVPADNAATPAAQPNDDTTKDTAVPATGPKTEEPPKDTAAPAAEPKADEPTQDSAAPAVEPKTGEPSQDAATPAAAPAKDTSTADTSPKVESPVVSALRQLIENRLDRYVARKTDREGIAAYYKANGYQPLWVTDTGANDRARAAIRYLRQVETVGLDSRDYPTPDFPSDAAESLASDELKLTNSVLTYARHAEIGRIHFSRVAADIWFELEPPNPAAVLAKLAEESDTAKALDGYNPTHPGFQALKAKLAEVRRGLTAKADANEPKRVRVPGGHILRPGMRDKRVAILRQRLDVAGDKDSTLYDQDVVEAVKAFQTQADLYVDGMLGPNTLAALNGEETHAPADPTDTIVVNMERWRWLPRKLGNADDTYVVVNVPDYSLSLFHKGKLHWKTRIVVGKPANMTPMISAEMKFITVNPTWNVPPSIIENEYLPALEADPTVLDRYGLKISQDRDGYIRIWQPPGDGNALGRLRFNFPNKFLVYQHDTPDKYLFKRDKRAYSHGCMRVQNPVEYAEKLLAIEMPEGGYSKRKIESMYGPNEVNINFPKPIPVHLTYQTAFVDEEGSLQFRGDVYRRDARMIQILNGREFRVADISVDHPPDTSAKPVRAPVGMYGSYDDGYYDYRSSGPGFFDFLFGGRPAPVEPPRYQRIYRPRGFIGPQGSNSGRYSNWR
jgi:murein L,D-transpeptidase YcbB/YkuD